MEDLAVVHPFAWPSAPGVDRTVDVDALIARIELPSARHAYESAVPFPHAVLDGVLDDDVFARAVEEFPPVDDPLWNRYAHVNELKYATTNVSRWGPTLRALVDALTSDRFVAGLERLTGFDGLVVDPSLDGGGLHQTLRGGHLNVHSDFTTHHAHPSWERRVNVLLYFNDCWQPEWGGDLEWWDRDMSAAVKSMPPFGNRMVVFTTSGGANHGHPEALRCPPGEARKSLALYYFTVEKAPRSLATQYRARPGDGWRRPLIWLDSMALRGYDAIKRHFGLSDRVVHWLTKRRLRG